jgi:hypothetical protein
MSEVKIYKELIGKTFHTVKQGERNFYLKSETLAFLGDQSYVFYHEQDGCEMGTIEDICGDLLNLEGFPVLQAEEVVIQEDYGTWTFSKFATIKGSVTVRWGGESNGRYSTSVDFMEVE